MNNSYKRRISALFARILFMGMGLSLLFACTKSSEDFLYKGDMLPVTIKGYNGGSEYMEVKIDTVKFKSIISTGRFDFSEAYLFPENKETAKLVITEKNTEKVVLERELKKGDGATTINFLYANDKVSDMPDIPALEQGKLKLIYMFKPTVTKYAGPVDIVLGKYYWTPKVFEEIDRIKDVKPYEFTKPITIATFPTVGQQYNGQPTPVSFVAYIYKAGTNEYYTKDTEYGWHATSSTAPKPGANAAASKLYVFQEAPNGGNMQFFKELEL
ncbi:hypothetical protein [Sphingobacterium yanglingense]|uniref:Uncharacterized protein n=1 Tax=Sphingobacterium yanglingense TaxID=1437280 RepID=A0A4R6W963_9SPHI|nr:hypothetical protein [Sphingobacterium yanglingense]TDQ73719.1 hypothetical protein CLV99_4156 [Sphingobacterium yanglingense]